MEPARAPKALYVQQILGPDYAVLEFPEATRTASDAAAAIGCAVARIAKSLTFRALDEGRPVLVIASGVNRVDEAKVASLLGTPVARADARFVREVTGYAIGGVSPVGHKVAPETLIDEDLFQFATIWAAAGTPNAVFEASPADLAALTGGRKACVKAKDIPAAGHSG